MRIIETKVYTFDELNDKAKEKARDWYRKGALDYDWWDSTYEDAERVGLKITSFDLGRSERITGEFIGSALETVDKIKTEHGVHCETFQTAMRYEPSLRETFAKCQSDPHQEDDDAYCGAAHEFLVDLLEDYRILLTHEMEYLLSDESVDETIRANEYEFLESGKRA